MLLPSLRLVDNFACFKRLLKAYVYLVVEVAELGKVR